MPSKAAQARAIDIALCKRSFSHFVKTFWRVLEPGTTLQSGWYVDAICDHLQALPRLRRLLVNIAPRHAKSIIVSVMYPAWVWLTKPETRFLCCSYRLALSQDLSYKCRHLIESKEYQSYFGDCYQLDQDRKAVSKFVNSKMGYRVATSVKGGNTGEGADVILVDDPQEMADVGSEIERQIVIDFWRGVLSSRLNDPKTGQVCIIQQRCHPQDLTGHILESGSSSWTQLVLPYLFNPEKRTETSLPWSDPRTEKDEPLSDRLDPEDIKNYWRKDSYNRRVFECVYNQNPSPMEGRIFQKSWFQAFTETPTNYIVGNRMFAKSDCWRIVGVDLAVSTNRESDFSVFATVAVTPEGDMIVLNIERKKINPNRMLDAIKNIQLTYDPAYFLIESTAFQDYVVQQVRAMGITVRKCQATQNKIGRSASLEVKMSSGQVWFPQTADWLPSVENEILNFPEGMHDDVVDALSYAAAEVSRKIKPSRLSRGSNDDEPEKPEDAEARLYSIMLMKDSD